MRPTSPLPAGLLLAVAACVQTGEGVRNVNSAPTAAEGAAAPAMSREDAATEAAVRGAVEGLIAADNVANAELATGFFADDAVLLPPQAAPIAGRDAIRAHYLTLFGATTPTLTARSQETLVSGDLAVDRGIVEGSLQPKGGGKLVAVHDQYLMVLRRDAARWKVLRLMWSPAAPAR